MKKIDLKFRLRGFSALAAIVVGAMLFSHCRESKKKDDLSRFTSNTTRFAVDEFIDQDDIGFKLHNMLQGFRFGGTQGNKSFFR